MCTAAVLRSLEDDGLHVGMLFWGQYWVVFIDVARMMALCYLKGWGDSEAEANEDEVSEAKSGRGDCILIVDAGRGTYVLGTYLRAI